MYKISIKLREGNLRPSHYNNITNKTRYCCCERRELRSALNQFSTSALKFMMLCFSFFPLPVRCIYFEQRAVQSAHKNTTTIKILKAKVENPSR